MLDNQYFSTFYINFSDTMVVIRDLEIGPRFALRYFGGGQNLANFLR